MKTTTFTIRLFLAALLIFIAGPAMAIEEPKYEVIEQGDRWEVRRYAPYLVAETVTRGDFEDAGNSAFRVLAAYIFGKNAGDNKIAMTAPVSQRALDVEGKKIAMTAPVSQRQSGDAFTVSFTMPAEYTLETLPAPIDERVTLREVPSQWLAVRTYSGSWSESGYQRNLSALQADIEKQGYKSVAEPVWARYNSPFSLPFFRRNEIQISVAVR